MLLMKDIYVFFQFLATKTRVAMSMVEQVSTDKHKYYQYGRMKCPLVYAQVIS